MHTLYKGLVLFLCLDEVLWKTSSPSLLCLAFYQILTTTRLTLYPILQIHVKISNVVVKILHLMFK